MSNFNQINYSPDTGGGAGESDEITKIEKERAKSDAEFLEGGAKYKFDKDGNKYLEPTAEQIEQSKREMIQNVYEKKKEKEEQKEWIYRLDNARNGQDSGFKVTIQVVSSPKAIDKLGEIMNWFYDGYDKTLKDSISGNSKVPYPGALRDPKYEHWDKYSAFSFWSSNTEEEKLEELLSLLKTSGFNEGKIE